MRIEYPAGPTAGMDAAAKNIDFPATGKQDRDAMKRALELLLKDDVQAIFDCFSSCFNIRILFYSPNGDIVTAGRTRFDNSSYCSLLQENLFGKATCESLDKEKRGEAVQEGRMICYRCHAGLKEAVMPIYAAKQLLGYVMIGQFRSGAEVPGEMAKEWAAKHPMPQLEAAYAELPLIPSDKEEDVLRLFSILVNYIVSQNLITLKGDLLVDEVLTFIESNIDRPVSLAEAAACVHRSESTVSHLFKKKLGKTFRQTVIDAKLDKAEEYMRTIPSLTVAEAAAMVGYHDPLHFSTQYKKQRGCAPSVYLKRCREG